MNLHDLLIQRGGACWIKEHADLADKGGPGELGQPKIRDDSEGRAWYAAQQLGRCLKLPLGDPRAKLIDTNGRESTHLSEAPIQHVRETVLHLRGSASDEIASDACLHLCHREADNRGVCDEVKVGWREGVASDCGVELMDLRSSKWHDWASVG